MNQRYAPAWVTVAVLALSLGGALALCFLPGWVRQQQLRAAEEEMSARDWPERAPAERRAVLHAAIAAAGRDPSLLHDVFLNLIDCGDESSVPLLIRVLDGARGEVCTESHGFAALRTITNQDFGSPGAAWQAWWQREGTKSRAEWRRSGFAALGIRIAVPLEEPALRALLEFLPQENSPRGRNAAIELSAVPEARLLPVLDRIVEGGAPNERRGVVAALRRAGVGAALPRLERLARDRSWLVAAFALAALNDRLRQHPESLIAGRVLGKIPVSGRITALGRADAARRILVASAPEGDRRAASTLSLVDLETRDLCWTVSLPGRVDSAPAIAGGCAFVAASDHSVLAVSLVEGRIVWRCATEPDAAPCGGAVRVLDDDLVLAVAGYHLWALGRRDGAVRWKLRIVPASHELVVLGGTAYALTDDGKLIGVTPDGKVAAQVQVGSGSYRLQEHRGRLVHRLRGGDVVAVRDPAALEFLGSFPLGDCTQWGDRADPGTAQTRVIVGTSYWTLALDLDARRASWAGQEDVGGYQGACDSGFVFRSPTGTGIEVRDPATGVLRVHYPSGPAWASLVLTLPDRLVVDDGAGALWLLSVPPAR